MSQINTSLVRSHDTTNHEICQPLAYTLTWTRHNGEMKTVDYSAFIIAILNWLFLKLKGYKPMLFNNKVDSAFDPEAYAKENGLIRKVKPNGELEEYIRLNKSDFKRDLEAKGIDLYETFIKVDASCSPYADYDTKTNAEALTHAALQGGLYVGGKRYLPLLQSASDARKGSYLACEIKAFPEIAKSLRAGIDISTLTGNVKKLALIYPALRASSSDEAPHQIDYNRIAVVKDLKMVLPKRLVQHVLPNNVVQIMMRDNEEINVLDGFALRVVEFKDSSLNVPSQERPGFESKCFVDTVTRQYLKKHYGRYINTIFGKMDIDDIDMILFESSAKWLSVFDDATKWSSACKKYNFKQNICGSAHKPVLKGLPYQQAQLLKGTMDEAKALAIDAANAVNAWRNCEKAFEVFKGNMRNIVELCPAILKTRWFHKLIVDAYRVHYDAILGGEIPEATLQFYVAPDLKFVLDYIYGKDPKCAFGYNQIVCRDIKTGTRVVLTRNPATDGIPEVEVVDGDEELYSKHVLYIHPLSWIPIWLRLDYDGDKVKVIVNQRLVKIARRTRKLYGDMPITFVQPGAKKQLVTRQALIDAIMGTIYGSQVGVFSDDLTRLLNASLEDIMALEAEFGEDIVKKLHAVLTKKVNVDIDSAKGAKDDEEEDPVIKKALKRVHKLPLPMFAAHSKAASGRGELEELLKKSEFTGSFVETYADEAEKLLPKPEDFTIIGLDNIEFNYRDAMINPDRPMKGYIGLAAAPKYDKVTDRYYNQGLFNNIAFRHKAEWAMLGKLEGVAIKEEREELRKAALKEINEYVKFQGGDEDGAYDVITRWFFTNTDNMSEEAYGQVARAYFDIYGDKLLSVLSMKFGFTVEEDDSEEDEELPW